MLAQLRHILEGMLFAGIAAALTFGEQPIIDILPPDFAWGATIITGFVGWARSKLTEEAGKQINQ